MGQILRVCIPGSQHDYFDYLAGPILPTVGARVKVPLGTREQIGIVIDNNACASGDFVLREIIAILDDEPLIAPVMLELLLWVAQYYQGPLSEVMMLALPKFYRQGKPLPEVLLDKYTEDTLLAETPLVASAEQQAALTAILAEPDSYQCFLLHGITGSGKTEVYLQAMEATLRRQQQILVLVPEIGLTPQLAGRFSARFNVPVVILHSHLNDTERFKGWAAARVGIAKIIIGTRAAVFTPLPAPGLIIIDEEHDASFKECKGVRYQARDTAIMRAARANIPIILGSATPALETLHNALGNKYGYLPLTMRAGAAHVPQFHVLDVSQHQMVEGIAAPTRELIQQHLAAGNQVLVFLNRRGFAPVLFCRQCAAMVDCPNCKAHLTLHRKRKCLCCHHCGHNECEPVICKSCHARALVATGYGTERVYEYLTNEFAAWSAVKIDRDAITGKRALERQLALIAREEARLLVGTQMLAKGHHFPKLSLVVILDTDYGLSSPDFRALETLGQLLTQVAGRAGRGEIPGEVLLQTGMPQHPLLQLLLKKGYSEFAKNLLAMRKEALLPPHAFMALIRARANNAAKVEGFLQKVKSRLGAKIAVLGPADAPMFYKARCYHMQLLLKAPGRAQLQEALTGLRHWLQHDRKLSGSVKWSIDVDPWSMD